jgi:mono/diheme cytochrome c family protein
MKHVALVLLAASLVVVGACSGAGEAADDSSPGRKVYVQAGCGGCHGADLQGLQTAPPLVDLAAHWDQASLTAYLRDPATVRANNPQLQYRAEAYAAEMPAFRGTDEELTQLTEYLLAP